ncbi:MAG TPA: M36 family metallopeptidase [Saprospiraceae bacterium]|nr:M36 family metallopeptidase [Saprospiraceae bacterium]HMQ84177.1 M36 family metallopeptidase [Saprospiraceae bacterium]
MKASFTRLGLAFLGLFLGVALHGQLQTPLDLALRHLEQQREQWQLTKTDIADAVVSDQYVSEHNGVTHIYFNQRYAGIELYNAINGVHITQDGKVAFATNRFTPALETRINATEPQLSAFQAIAKAAAYHNMSISGTLRLLEQVGDRQFLYEGGNISNSDIKVQLKYQLMKDGSVKLAWDLALDMPTTADYWSMRVDAISGEILDQNNWTVYCNFSHHEHNQSCGVGQHREMIEFIPVQEALLSQNMVLNDNAQYRVYPAPFESPLDGDREMVMNPADPSASPYGWHDVNGMEGAEYRITRGNNAHAFLDLDNTDTSSGDEPDGGEQLIFDFPINLNLEPSEYQEAAVTQLFYMNNIMHDMAHAYGMNSAAGSFQQNNYGNGGAGGDYVLAQAQDGGGTNNANFGTPPDGGNGRMQMYLWNSVSGNLVTVLEPTPIAGSFEAGTADYGTPVSSTPLIGEVAEAFDGTADPDKACGAIVNGDEITGKIALVNRGLCFFEEKTVNVEAAGAIALIICNFEEAVINMAGVAEVPDPSIPTVMLKNSDCQLIRQALDAGVVIQLKVPEAGGPTFRDGDLDNGIIAHEYGHGISNRLTGGPSAAGCLGNGEQMGEGWSDFFSLITSAKPGDDGAMPRPIGAYANGIGIRRKPYSTDMAINDQTYKDVIGQGVHALGEVWVGATWDLYWAMTDLYGFDADLINGTGGNNMAIQLVMDGMKLQACSPGFLDGRDAILMADQLNYDGQHECLIWEVFARRGLGYFAGQGSSDSNTDGTENFDPRPECIMELKITKRVTEFINAGEEITVNLTVTNHKGAAVSGVSVQDEIPIGAAFVAGSATGATANATANAITFEIGDMADGEVIQLAYKLSTSLDVFSGRFFLDDVETNETENIWLFDIIDPIGFDVFQLTELAANSGDRSWYVPNVATVNDQVLYLIEPYNVIGANPAMRFYHRYDTETGADAGFIEISNNGGSTWTRVEQNMIRNGYPGIIQYGTFAIPYLQAFSGLQDEWIATYVDLSAYAGQNIQVRFRFGSDDNTAPLSANPGWYIDDIEFMDLFSYNGEACVTSNEGDLACAVAEARGTIVESQIVNASQDQELANGLRVFPNPANDLLHIAMNYEGLQEVEVQLLSVDGQVLTQQRADLRSGFQTITVNTATLPTGFYLVKIFTGNAFAVQKVVIK